MTKLTLGVIGCNNVVIDRYVRLAGRTGFTLHSLYAPDHPKVPAVASFPSAQALIDSDVDAVAIGPNNPKAIPWAVRHSKHVLLHQPVCADYRELREVLAAINEAGRRHVTVQLIRRFRADPAYGWLKGRLPALMEMYGRLDEFGLTYSGPTDGEPFSLASVAQLGYLLDDLDYLHFMLGNSINQAEWSTGRDDESVVEGIAAKYVKFRFWRLQRPFNRNEGCSVWLKFIKITRPPEKREETWCLLLAREGSFNICGRITNVPRSNDDVQLAYALRGFAAAIRRGAGNPSGLAEELEKNYRLAASIMLSGRT
jgi:hypothetical protein